MLVTKSMDDWADLSANSMEEDDIIEEEGSTLDGSSETRQTKQMDLFSEIHLNQMKRLEKQLESVEGEKNVLSKSLKEIQEQLEKGKSALGIVQSALISIVSHIDALECLKAQTTERISKQPEVEILVSFFKQLRLLVDRISR